MDVLQDVWNLHLLRYLVSGTGVSVNIRGLAKELNIHRATVHRKIRLLFDQHLLNPPFYSFPYIYNEYPLLILVKADMPRSNETIEFLKDDSHIFAAFSCMEGPYNTFMIEFFRDLESYHSWREQIVFEQRIPTRDNRAAAESIIFSNNLMFKYNPNCYINNLQKQFDKDGFVVLNDIKLDATAFQIMSFLMNGEFIHRNDSYLSRQLEVDRKTIRNRVDLLIKHGIVSPPKCYFPHLFIPPGYNLIVSMIEVKKNHKQIKQFIMLHNSISRAQEASTGRYNYLLFSAFPTIERFFELGDELFSSYPDSIGAIQNTILSSRMLHTIKPQKISLGWIERKIWEIQQTRKTVK